MQFSGDTPVRVALVAPRILSWAMEEAFKSSPRMLLVATAETLDSVRSRLSIERDDVIVVDLDEGITDAAFTGFLGQGIGRVIALSGRADLDFLDAAVLAGLRGFVRKNESPGELFTAIEKVHDGEIWIDRAAMGRIFMEMARQKAAAKDDPEHAKISLLTPRERQAIAALVADTAAPAKVIASRLCMSEHTLRNHLTSIYGKLQLSNRLDLYAYATRNKLARDGE